MPITQMKLWMMLVTAAIPATAQLALADNGYTLTTLVNFNAPVLAPSFDLYRDASGNFFGTSVFGGTNGMGVAFKVDGVTHNVATLGNFDGAAPLQNPPRVIPHGVIADAAGNLYGGTSNGGSIGLGSIYMLSAANNYSLSTVLDVTNSTGRLTGYVVDSLGTIYISTAAGSANGKGGILKLDPQNNYALTTVVDFGANEGSGGLSMDSHGNIYGYNGFANGINGSIYKVDVANKNRITLATVDSSFPKFSGKPTIDDAGNIYGFSSASVTTLFKLTAANNYQLSTLATLSSNAGNGFQTLMIDSAGNIFGATQGGGSSLGGTVFELVASNNYARVTLVNFGVGNGLQPVTSLVLDSFGMLYGTSSGNANGVGGTLFQLTPVPEPAAISVLGFGVISLLMRRNRKAMA